MLIMCIRATKNQVSSHSFFVIGKGIDHSFIHSFILSLNAFSTPTHNYQLIFPLLAPLPSPQCRQLLLLLTSERDSVSCIAPQRPATLCLVLLCPAALDHAPHPPPLGSSPGLSVRRRQAGQVGWVGAGPPATSHARAHIMGACGRGGAYSSQGRLPERERWVWDG